MAMRLLMAIVALALGFPAHAGDASHRQACEEYVDTLNMDKMIGPMYAQINKMQEEMIAKMDIPDELVDVTKEYLRKINELMERELRWDSMKQDFIDIHIAVFSEPEIREMTRFYKSPVGRKYVEKSPELVQKFFMMSRKRVAALLPGIEKLSEEFRKEVELRRKSAK